MPRRKDKVTSSEYARLPQMYQDMSYQDMQDSTPEKLLQDYLGPFRESEHQQPFMNPELDYQELENSAWNTDSPMTFLPPSPFRIPPKSQKSSCKGLWDQMFPTHKIGDFIPSRIDLQNLYAYEKVCPVEFVWYDCCDPSTHKITCSKKTVNAGETAILKVVPETMGCMYTFSAKYGSVYIDTYTAPSSTGPTGLTDIITLTVWPPMQSGNVCAQFPIKVNAVGCSGETIAFSGSQQMNVSQTQTLSVAGAVGGKTYTFEIASGGGSFSNITHTHVDYTSPATNVDCLQNATINLKLGTSICDTKKIAINAAMYSYPKAVYICNTINLVSWYHCMNEVQCDGTTWEYPDDPTCKSHFGKYAGQYFAGTCASLGYLQGPYPGHDQRAPAMIAGGCCPFQLL